MSIETFGTTAANSNSSCSHAVLQIILKTSSSNSVPSNISWIHNNYPAGSERGKDAASGDRLRRMEDSEINIMK